MPTRPAPPPRSSSGELERGDALLFASGIGGDDRGRARLRAARNDDRAGRGRVLRHVGPLPDARLVGPRARRVRPDRAAAADADIVWVEAPANPVLTVPDWELLRAHPAARRLRRHRLDARLPALARRGRRRRRPLGDEVPDRQPLRSPRRDRHARPRAHAGAPHDPHADGKRLLARLGGCAPEGARVALAAHAADHRDGDRDRPPPRGASGGRASCATRATRG